MVCGFSREELFILWKIAYRGRWCNKHISRDDLISGRPRSESDKYRAAIDSLIRKGWLRLYKSRGEDHVCIEKGRRNELLNSLRTHQREYDFIRYLEFIR